MLKDWDCRSGRREGCRGDRGQRAHRRRREGRYLRYVLGEKWEGRGGGTVVMLFGDRVKG